MKYIKKIYSQPFLNETRSVIDMLMYRSVVNAAWLAYYLKYRSVLSRTANFINEKKKYNVKHKRKAFVFANGPSVGDIDLSKIAKLCETGEFDLIAINSYLSKSADVAKPTYAVFADNIHFNNPAGQYKADIDKCKELGVTYFAPAKYAEGLGDAAYAYCSLCDIDSTSTSDVLRPAGYYGVTAFFALSLACMLSYEEIYICGFDNSYFLDYEVSDAGEMFVRHRHYYDNGEKDTLIPTNYAKTSDFFMDVYRHFKFLERIVGNSTAIHNIAKRTYLSMAPRNFGLDVYRFVE